MPTVTSGDAFTGADGGYPPVYSGVYPQGEQVTVSSRAVSDTDAGHIADTIGGYTAAYTASYPNTTPTPPGFMFESVRVVSNDPGHGNENFPLITLVGLGDQDTGSGADAGIVGTVAVKSGSDTAAGADAQSSPVPVGGAGPGFPLIFQMLASANVPPTADSASLTDAGTVTHATLRDTDTAHGGDAGVATGHGTTDPGQALPAITTEGFSISRLGVLLPGQLAELGTLYGVRTAGLAPQWTDTPTLVDDWVQFAWAAPGKLALSVEGGFLPWDVLAAIYGTDVSSQGTAPQDYYSLPYLVQRTPPPFSLVAHVSAKASNGAVRNLLLVLYAATFGPINFDGPAYKNGLSASYTAQLVLSAQDETGLPLGSPAFGRIDSLPAGGTYYLPGLTTSQQVVAGETGAFREFAGVTVLGSHPVASTDSAHGGEQQSVNTQGGTVFVSDSDAWTG